MKSHNQKINNARFTVLFLILSTFSSALVALPLSIEEEKRIFDEIVEETTGNIREQFSSSLPQVDSRQEQPDTVSEQEK